MPVTAVDHADVDALITAHQRLSPQTNGAHHDPIDRAPTNRR